MKAADLKIGDRIRLTGGDWGSDVGKCFDVAGTNDVGPFLLIDGDDCYPGDPGSGWDFEYIGAGGDPVDPDHYRFPGGIETRQISAHLTSLGGQALQYIARSTRLDGANKGDPVTDLRKAIRLLEWEIERIETSVT